MIRDDFYGISPAPPVTGPEHFAYLPAGNAVQLSRYVGGTWVADLGSPQPMPLRATPVILDVTGGLEPGSVVGGGGDEIVTTDFVAGQQTVLAVEEGWWAGPPVYVHGGIHWLERAESVPAGELIPVRLRRTNGRLQNVSTLGGIAAGFIGTANLWVNGADDPLFTSSAAAFTVTSSDEVDVPVRVRITYAGAADQAFQGGGGGGGGGVAAIARSAAPVRISRQVEFFQLPGVPSVAGSIYSAFGDVRLWPGTSAAESTQSWLPVSWGIAPIRAGVSRNGSTVLTYGDVGGERRALHSTTNPSAAPSAAYTVEPHPTLGVLPDLFWPAF